LNGFGEMITDCVRLDAYAQALQRVVTPTSIVLDIGAGTGILSLLACQFGARRVYAIEPSGLSQLISETARDNGYAERIVLLQQRSTELTLPERADVIVSDLRGVLPAFHSHFSDIADARTRLLAPGGKLIPQTDTLFAAVIAAPAVFEEARRPWQSDPYRLTLHSALRFVDNTWRKYRAATKDVLCEPVEWARLDYTTINDARFRGSGTCTIATDGTADGLLAWFDTQLTEGVGFSNRPGAPEAIYGQAFFRWPCAVSLQAGDSVSCELRADPMGSDYVWTWTTEIRTQNAPEVVSQRFRQSTFLSAPLSPDTLRKRAATFTPTLSATGELALGVLERMRAGASLGKLATALHSAHPERFRSYDDALAFVGELSERYST
jgi:protein arginine N-methyltransferase 1